MPKRIVIPVSDWHRLSAPEKDELRAAITRQLTVKEQPTLTKFFKILDRLAQRRLKRKL